MSKAATLDFEVLKQPSANVVTNLVTNGGFESGINTEWQLHGTGVTIATDATASFVGAQSAKTVTPGTTNPEGIELKSASYVAVTPLKLYIVSVWVKAPSSQAMQLQVTRFTSGLGNLGTTSKTFTGTGAWQQIIVALTADATATFFRIGIYTFTTAAITFNTDAVQVEEANSIGAPSPYIDTNGSTASRTYPQGSPSPVLLSASSTTKQIVVATINATSTISGSIVAKRAILPASINATSSLSGRVAALRPVIASNINAASSLSGNVVARRTILPASINATSALSGRVAALKHITSANITATSSLSAGVIKTSHLQTSNVTATSTLSGSVAKLIRIAGNINASSTINVILIVKRSILPTSISATSTVAGTIVALHHITGNINAASTLSSAVGALRKVSPANINATSTLSGNIGRLKFIVNTGINATSVLSGNLNTTRNILSANISGISTITGQLSNIKHIVPVNIIITTNLNGDVRLVKAITPDNINATSTISGGILKVVFHGPLITFDLEVGNKSWFASVTKQNWSATSILPIRDWNVRV